MGAIVVDRSVNVKSGTIPVLLVGLMGYWFNLVKIDNMAPKLIWLSLSVGNSTSETRSQADEA